VFVRGIWSVTSTVLALGCLRPISARRAGERAGWLRCAAVAAGFAAFIVTLRSILAGVVCGELLMLAGKWWLG